MAVGWLLRVLGQEGRDIKVDQTETVTMGAITRATRSVHVDRWERLRRLGWLTEIRNPQWPEMKLLKYRTGIGKLFL